MTTAVAVKKDAIRTMLSQHITQVSSLLPKHVDVKKTLRHAHNAINANPALRECTGSSLLNCVLEAASLGLDIGGPLGLAHMLPFRNKRTGRRTATLVIGYRGFMELAYRSGLAHSFQAHAVFRGDRFSYEYGTNPHVTHTPKRCKAKGELVAAYAIVDLGNGSFDFEVVERADAMAAKGKSAAKFKKDSPWNTEDEWTMWVKTAIRRLAKRLPMSPELQRAAVVDDLADSSSGQGLNHVPPIDITIQDDLTKTIHKSADTGPSQELWETDSGKRLQNAKDIDPDIYERVVDESKLKTEQDMLEAVNAVNTAIDLEGA